MTGFRFFVGIDQTGASSNNIAKPLPAALIDSKQQTVELALITSLNPQSMKESFPSLNLEKSLIVVDSVLGLPKECLRSGKFSWSYFERSIPRDPMQSRYGRYLAHDFFCNFKKNLTHKPTRLCEDLAEANSIFDLTPFQRNISTGSFRIWQDLGSEKKWCSLLHFEDFSKSNGPWLSEGYPSLIWKKHLGLKSRNSKDLLEWVKSNSSFRLAPPQKKRLLKDPNMADAFVLALGASILQKKRNILRFPKTPRTLKEGWILGL